MSNTEDRPYLDRVRSAEVAGLYTPAVRRFFETMKRRGWTCTHCGVNGKPPQQYRLSTGEQTLVICRLCGWPQEFDFDRDLGI